MMKDIEKHEIFEEYNHDFVHLLKESNSRFRSIYEKFLSLDKEIRHVEIEGHGINDFELEKLKKERLQIRDEAQLILREFKKSNIGEA